MNALLILIVAIAILLVAYVGYGKWLAKTWGVDESRPTPSHTMEDGVDYVPAKAPVLLGHHFSSIAGAGPINGPIQAACFGWVPVILWVLIGGIFFGAVHDFGALFASIRHKGQSMGEVIGDTMGTGAKRLFTIFGYLVLLLVVAAFASIVASTFGSTSAAGEAVQGAALDAHATTAVISLLFIAIAIVFGFMVYRRNAGLAVSTVIGVVAIVAIVAIGLVWHPLYISYNVWMYVLGFYILVASVTPVWILLQPRDYLSSFLLYFMVIVAVLGVVGCAIAGKAQLDMPAFTSFTQASNGLLTGGTMFPALFVTIACGAISGFHSLVSSGTTSKQIDNERDARPIGYGAMLIECVVAVLALIAVGYVFKDASAADATAKGLTSPTVVFATGISQMIGTFVGADSPIVNVMYTMLTLAVSVFCLTSLDTATRLARYMFQELWLKEGETVEDAKKQGGAKAFFTNMYVATIITVVLGVGLGMTGYAKIWPLFGAANQLLAAVGLLGVAAWLGHVGKNNKMMLFPMIFMLVVTIASLGQTIQAKLALFTSNGFEAAKLTPFWAGVQMALAILLIVLSLILAVKGITTIAGQFKGKGVIKEEK
ncbi:MAG: carbon starvation protein A [Lachnospiraceae bacterium]|nr:carbon starvation protein A [Lachnospiraceae bacterium]MDD3616206.1 carbon starvation protein A [Lachnospiraceae bacterium]